METRVINNETQYETTLSEAEELISLDPDSSSQEGERLTLLSLLIENYEKNRFSFERPSPLAAITFRMEEQGLNQTDLVPLIGSRSKVSEVLRGKRPLTLAMIRRISAGLKIPAEILIQEPNGNNDDDFEWKLLPLKTMRKFGWIDASLKDIREHPDRVFKRFLLPLGSSIAPLPSWKRTVNNKSDSEKNQYALYTWACRVLILAKNVKLQGTFSSGVIDENFRRQLARLSWSEQGPLLAKEFLARNGIVLVIEKHLDGTRLDGAAMLAEDGTPVIGLTLRYDRIDNFWFVLLHELAHIEKHLQKGSYFFDEIDYETTDGTEEQANTIARESFIPLEKWRTSKARRLRTASAVIELAKQLDIHPAIVAGRLQHESKNFTIMRELLGQGEVRRMFEGGG